MHVARRRFGQNFLVDPRAAARIVGLLAPRRGEGVLEIGPGTGALTGPLVEAAGRVAAVEVDRDLAARLRARFGERLVLLEGDVLDQDFARIAAALGASAGAGLAVAGNLPYNVSKPIALKLVSERAAISRAVLTFQREVAGRLTASPGSKDYAPITVLAGRAFRIERAFDLPPGAFRPAPKVVSTVTTWTRREAADLTDDLERRLRSCLAVAFAHRRKTLLANLRSALPGGEDTARALLVAAGLDPGDRAEAVPADGLVALARLWEPGPATIP